MFALQSGLQDVAEFLRKSAPRNAVRRRSVCGRVRRADKGATQRLLAASPDIFSRLSEAQLRQLPNLTESRNLPAVRLMVELGWPIAVTGGDWKASALNLAVYQGDPEPDPLSS